MRRSLFNPNLGYVVFSLMLIIGIVAFAVFSITAPPGDGAALVAAKTTKSTGRQISVPPGTGADAGEALFQVKGCISCHVAPAFPGGGAVGPSLVGFAARPQIAEAIPNNRENLARWLENPPAVKPGTQMPALGLTPEEIEALSNWLDTTR